jgi:hypothetical protein
VISLSALTNLLGCLLLAIAFFGFPIQLGVRAVMFVIALALVAYSGALATRR